MASTYLASLKPIVTKGIIMKAKKESVELTEVKRQAFMEQEHVCPLCSDTLEVKVKDYLGNYQIAEEASCSSCDLVIRNKNHRFH